MAKTFRSILSERVFILIECRNKQLKFRLCQMVFTPNNYLLYHAASSEIVGRVLIVHESITHGLGLDQQHPLHGRTIALLCASAAVGSEPPEDFSSRCCSSPSSYLFYFSSSNATRNCHLFAFICTRPRRHGYIDNLTSVAVATNFADTCRRPGCRCSFR